MMHESFTRDDNGETLNAHYVPLWYHEQGLSQTASGYGKKLKTVYKVENKNRLYRVYTDVVSNSNVIYIYEKQKKVYLR